MKAKLSVLFVLLISTIVLVGCDGSNNDNRNALTVDNLRGTWNLNLDVSSDEVTMLADNLNIVVVVLEISLTTFDTTSTDEKGNVNTATFTYTIIDDDTIRTTDEDGESNDLQATLTNNGNRLTLIDEEGIVVVFDRR